MSRFQYQGRSKETVAARATMSGGDFDSYLNSTARFFKVSEGEHTIRILPPTWDTKSKKWGDNWGIEIFIHRDIGPDKGAYLCPEKMEGKPCPICEARAEESDEEIVKALRPGKQTLAWVIDRDNQSDGPLVMRFGIKAEKEVQTRSSDKKTGAVILIDDPEEGFDIFFRRNGSGLKTEYVGWEVDRDPSPIHEKESKQEAWLEFIQDNPLPDLLIIHDYDYLDSVYRGKRSSKSDKADAEAGDKDEGRPSRSSRRSREEPADDDKDEGRSRSREEPDRRGSRSRDDDPKDDDKEEDRRGSRSRDRDDDRGGRSRSRDKADEPDDDILPDDKQMKENSDRGRHRSREEPADDDKDEGRSRSRSRSRDDDPKDDDKKESSTGRAKESLQRLQPKGKK